MFFSCQLAWRGLRDRNARRESVLFGLFVTVAFPLPWFLLVHGSDTVLPSLLAIVCSCSLLRWHPSGFATPLVRPFHHAYHPFQRYGYVPVQFPADSAMVAALSDVARGSCHILCLVSPHFTSPFLGLQLLPLPLKSCTDVSVCLDDRVLLHLPDTLARFSSVGWTLPYTSLWPLRHIQLSIMLPRPHHGDRSVTISVAGEDSEPPPDGIYDDYTSLTTCYSHMFQLYPIKPWFNYTIFSYFPFSISIIITYIPHSTYPHV